MEQPKRCALLIALMLAGACAPDDRAAGAGEQGAASDPQQAFWSGLAQLCGRAYQGEIVASAPAGADDDFAGQEMVMHVRECEEDVIRIPFHVGDDRSRTWVISRTADGLRLKHDHRHEDGSPDEITMYGGDTSDQGTATTQEFPADAETAAMLPAAATNVWTVGVQPGRTFTYELRREGTGRLFRVAFDLTEPVPAPSAPWGS
ncbi:MAG TPA: hypothetical protein VMM12_07055 [Longimicrobiales bacterium]|nr:hypothetical protein [Longimicrobiales bacterium]